VAEKDGLGITKIMYSSYLSYRQVARYLEFMTEIGLMDYDERNRLYRITLKGLYFIKLYDEMDGFFKERRSISV
jgi:predicted transcriptional regulator